MISRGALLVATVCALACVVAAATTTTTTTTRFVLRAADGKEELVAKNTGCGSLITAMRGARDAGLYEYFGADADETMLRDKGFDVVEVSHGTPLRDAPPSGYHTPEEIFGQLSTLAIEYPSLARWIDITAQYNMPETIDGNHIYALKISANVNENVKPAIVLVANHHARELVTPEIALNISLLLVTEYNTNPEAKHILDTYQVYVLPTNNPDGLNYVWTVDDYWRKNRKLNRDGSYGVDNNRNYPIGWDYGALCAGSQIPGAEDYRGESPASEIETQTMIVFQEDIRPTKVLDLHSYAREVRIIYADCVSLPSLVDNFFQEIATSIADAIDYEQARSCCFGGNIATAYHNFGSLAFLIETATAFQPPADMMHNELVRLQPGILQFLSLPAPVSGYITDARSGLPVEAFIDIPSIVFPLEETRPSDPKSGRYHLWLPDGTYNITVTVPNYRSIWLEVEASAAGTVLDIII